MSLPGGPTVCRPLPLTLNDAGEAGLTLLSDPHIGSAWVDYQLLEEELKQAALHNDRILINGDLFDAILTQDEKRFEADVLHPRLRGAKDQVNRALDWAEEIFSPYADRLDMIGCGNHDTKLEKKANTDVIGLLVDRLRKHIKKPDQQMCHGGYVGFVRYDLGKKPFTIFYWHGAGGGAGLGGAANELHQKAHFIEGADLVWFGHRHVRLALQMEKLYCPASGGVPRRRPYWFVRTGSYIRAYEGQTQQDRTRNGRRACYSTDMLLPPQGCGGARIVLSLKNLPRVELR